MKFLEQDWFDAVNAKIAADDEIEAAIAHVDVSIQQQVTDCPSGDDIMHYMQLKDGEAVVSLGELEEPDATMISSYETASAMQSGELTTMAAFAGGKMKVAGNMAVLMMHQATLTKLNAAFEAVRDDTEYAG